MEIMLRGNNKGCQKTVWLLSLVLFIFVSLGAHAAGNSPNSTTNRALYLLQLDNKPDKQLLGKLKAAGISLVSAADNNEWMASGPVDIDQRLLQQLGKQLKGISEFPGHRKLSRRLQQGKIGKHATDGKGRQLVTVRFADWVSNDEQADILQRFGARSLSQVSSIHSHVIVAPEKRIIDLANLSSVVWIEEPLPPLATGMTNTREIIGAEILHWFPYNLRGAGVSALVYDGDIIYDHTDLEAPRVIWGSLPIDDQGINRLHATHVSGIFGGSGALSSGVFRGMAPEANIISHGFCCTVPIDGPWLYTDPGDIEADYQNSIDLANISLATNSLSTNIAARRLDCTLEGDYGVTSGLLDDIVRGALGKPLVVTWAVGNERGEGFCGTEYSTVPPPANAKNIIAVGATDTTDAIAIMSSWGPSDDGRIKPDVVAPGVLVTSTTGSILFGTETYSELSGTSMATPAVAGLAALMLEQFRITNPNEADPYPASTKAALIHTALDLGNPGPDYQFGYGRVEGEAAMLALSDLAGHVQGRLVAQGETVEYQLIVAEGLPEVKVTLAWDDPSALPLAAQTLVHDIDLELVSPSGTTFYPWILDPGNPGSNATRGPDHASVVEMISVANPEAGVWTVRIKATQLLPLEDQRYSLIITPNTLDRSGFPTVTGFSPALDRDGPDTTTFVLVFGSNFVQDQTTVTINGLIQPLTHVYSDEVLITILTGGDTTGPVEVYTPSGNAKSSTTFGIAPEGLTISGVLQKSGIAPEIVLVFGSGYTADPDSLRFFINNEEIFLGQAIDDNFLVFQIQQYSTTGPITIATSAGSVSTSWDFLVIKPPPTVDAMDPDFYDAATSENGLVNLIGTNYFDVIDVTFNGISVDTFGVITDGYLQSVIPSGATTGPVCVHTPGGIGCGAADFVITGPLP